MGGVFGNALQIAEGPSFYAIKPNALFLFTAMNLMGELFLRKFMAREIDQLKNYLLMTM
jgi:hypothetical protein